MKSNRHFETSQAFLEKNLGFLNKSVLDAFLALPENAQVSSSWRSTYSQIELEQNFHSQRKLVYNCHFAIPKTFQRTDFSPPKQSHSRADPAKKYKLLYDDFQSARVRSTLLLRTFQKRMSERPLCYVSRQDGEGSLFYGLIKGCHDYNLKLEEKIRAKSKELVSRGGAFYFLTVTYSPNTHGKAIVDAWKTFSRQLYPFMHSLSRKYRAAYCCVLESTLAGYPHAHILLQLPSAPDIKHRFMKPGQKYKYGKLLDFIKKRVPSPIFILQKAEPYALVNYLTKYVSKGLDKLEKKVSSGSVSLSNDNRKALLSCMCPVLAQIRQFRSSIKSSRIVPLSLSDSDFEKLETLRACAELGIFSESAEAYLIGFLNNLTARCRSHVWAIFNAPGKAKFQGDIGFYDSGGNAVIRDFKRQAHPLGCPGCFLTDWVDKRLGRVPEKIDYVTPYAQPPQETFGDTRVPVPAVMAELSNLPDRPLETMPKKDISELENLGIVVDNYHIMMKPEFLHHEERA